MKLNQAHTLSLLLFVVSFYFCYSSDKVNFVKNIEYQKLIQSDSTKTNEVIVFGDSDKVIDFPEFIPPNYLNHRANYFNVELVPKPRGKGILGYISDPNNYISSSEEEEINKILFSLEKKTSAEVIIVIVNSIGDEVPKKFATKLFNKWGIGKADKDNGLLILTVVDQRRTEFETGYGLEAILTDNICFRIGTDEIVPPFKKGDYGKGLINALTVVKKILQDPNSIDEIYSNIISYDTEYQTLAGSISEKIQNFFNYIERLSAWKIFFLFYILICIFYGIYFYINMISIQKSKEDYYDKYNRLADLKLGCLPYLFPIPMLRLEKIRYKRLKQYRYNTRFSKVNGKLLVLLDSKKEIEHLNDGQLVEENIESVDYDVWVTEDKSDILILNYAGVSSRKYTKCSECNYKTNGKVKSDVVKRATYENEGKRIDYYECKNCNKRTDITIVLAKRVRESSSSSGSSSRSGSSYSSSSSSSSSSSFGGGRSGGGGAGVSW